MGSKLELLEGAKGYWDPCSQLPPPQSPSMHTCHQVTSHTCPQLDRHLTGTGASFWRGERVKSKCPGRGLGAMRKSQQLK